MYLNSLGNFVFFVAYQVFSKINFFEHSDDFVRKTTRVSNSLDPDQVRTFVGPDLGQDCFKQLSIDDNSRQKKVLKCVSKYWVVCQAKIWLQERWCARVVVCTAVNKDRHKQVCQVESRMFASKPDKSG